MSNSNDKFAKRIKMLRKMHNMSQEELASLIGIGKTAICNYESGYSVPRGDTLLNLCRIFDVQMEYLMGITDLRIRFMQYAYVKTIPMYDSMNIAALKSGVHSDVISYIQIPDSIKLRDGDFIALTVTDDSLAKSGIAKNDVVIVKKYIKNEKISYGKMYAVLIENKLYMKILRENGDGITLDVNTDDKNLKAISIKSDAKFEIIGQIVQAIISIK